MSKQYFNYSGLYTFSYFSVGALFPLLAQYLSSIGLTGVQIGTVMASYVAVGIVSSPLWGAIYDRSAKNKKLLYFLYIMPALLIFSLMFVKEYIMFLLIYTAAFFFKSPVFPLNDSMTLGSGNAFGKIRQWGAVGYALGGFAAGLIAQSAGLKWIFPVYSISLLTGLFFLTTIRNEKVEPAEENTLHGFGRLFRNKKFMALIVCAFFMNGPALAHNTYFGVLYTQAGGNIAGVGLAFLLFAGSEAPFMRLSEYAVRKICLEKLILLSIILSSLRFLWYSTAPAPAFLIGTFFLQGIVNGIFLVKIVQYISRTVPEEMRSTAITVYTALASGIGNIACQYFGGVIMAHYSGAAIYFMFFIFNLVSAILYIGFRLYRQ